MKNRAFLIIGFTLLLSCNKESMDISVYETSRNGNQMKLIEPQEKSQNSIPIVIDETTTFQTITGFGGSFTEASASLLNKMSDEKRQEIIEAYFGESGAKYSLTRTHINSCDFSLSNYAYVEEMDEDLSTFDIEPDKEDIIPMIRNAMDVSKEGFNIIASPWSAPPWMKDNNDWRGGKLLPKYYETWAEYFHKYLSSYEKEGINIWGITVENEPLGNDGNWESMHFTPEEMGEFVQNHLGPTLEKYKHDTKILGYDQNREHLIEWVDEMYHKNIEKNYYDGTAIHWYASTYEVFPEALQYAHEQAPDKYLIQTEACVDAEVPVWQDDEWYWKKEATDWGWDWAPEKDKYLHPKYAPVNRYARDIIGCLNNWVDGWIDWNMVLNKQGGPNWFKNWCIAPVIVDTETDEVYYTPLYFVMTHFSRYIRPGAKRIEWKCDDPDLLCTAVKNPNGELVIVLFNPSSQEKSIEINNQNKKVYYKISAQSIQSIIIGN